MPQRDLIHDLVRRLLEENGWTITHDPLTLALGQFSLYVDLGAIAAERGDRKIAVEVKSFTANSSIAELEKAIGQYAIYRFALRERDPQRTLYLALPDLAFEKLFRDPVLARLRAHLDLKLIVVPAGLHKEMSWIE